MFAETFTSISKDPIGRWKTNTSMRDLVILQAIVGDLMESVGYEPEKVSMKSFNVEDRIRILKEQLIAWLKPE